MTKLRNIRQLSAQAEARVAVLTPAQLSAETPFALVSRLHRMADEVAQLQSEIAAVEAFVTEPSPARAVERPGADWKPTPTPQPWLEARTA